MKLVVNGAEVAVDDRHAKTPLLWVLRDVLGMHGTKFGCGAGFCAACTVLVDGRNTKACQTATERVVGKSVTTVEGASGAVVDAVRDAWHRGNVVQCGYCQPGQTLAAVSLLESDPLPDDTKIDEWMSGNLCRCGTYPRIRAAIHEAAGTIAAGSAFQYTGASSSTRGFWVRYRVVAAQARARLAAAAAELWDVPADEIQFERGVVRHGSGEEATFAQLAARAEQLPVPDDVEP